MIGSGQHKGSISAGGEQSWRKLAGSRRSRVNSPQARRRRQIRWIKFLSTFFSLILVIGGIAWFVWAFNNEEEQFLTSPVSKPIERILFDTNGVLSDHWLRKTVHLQVGMSLMEADIHELKKVLEANAQVESASVERVFPSTLRINLVERRPVLRLALMEADGRQHVSLVARDGAVYDGVGYTETMLKNLPFVQPYKHIDGSFLPMRGIEQVAELLELIRTREPGFFRSCRVVSLEHYSGDLDLPGEVIEVRSTIVPRIIFGASIGYSRQLERLFYIFEYLKNQGNPPLKRIDLSLPGSAAVQFNTAHINSF